VRFLARRGVRDFYRAAREVQVFAFSTSSSNATLPLTMRTAEDKLGVSRRISRFVLPLGATINMDGTALYQGVAVMFIAQVFGIELSVVTQLTVVLTATLASIGAAGVPSAGIITLALVLVQAGVPETGIALILGVDRILDMLRTAVNVTGDMSAAAFVARSEGEVQEAVAAG
jgi:Na+/H+-dicarboxylate symporter